MDPRDLAGRLPGLTTLDRVRLGRRLEGVRRVRDPKKRDRERSYLWVNP